MTTINASDMLDETLLGVMSAIKLRASSGYTTYYHIGPLDRFIVDMLTDADYAVTCVVMDAYTIDWGSK